MSARTVVLACLAAAPAAEALAQNPPVTVTVNAAANRRVIDSRMDGARMVPPPPGLPLRPRVPPPPPS